MPPYHFDLLHGVHELVFEATGCRGAVTGIKPLQLRRDAAVVLAEITDSLPLVVKLSGPEAEHPVSYERTAMLTALARSAGAPVPQVLLADDSRRRRRWRYLVAEHIEGIPWRDARPQMTADQVIDAHRQLAVALLAVQSVKFLGFGELDQNGQPPAGQDLLTALHRRTDFRVRAAPARASFHQLLDRKAALFTEQVATLSHDDLHHGNVLFRPYRDGWRLVALLDWDKGWAGSAESDVARMSFWDDMTGPGFWEVYRAGVPAVASQQMAERLLIYQLLWCLEHEDSSPRHTANTARLRRDLAVP